MLYFQKLKATGCWLLILVLAGTLRAQDHSVAFSTIDPGVTRAITNWGLDTCWPNFDNMQRGLIFMGTNNVNLVRVGFFVDAPLTNNDVTPADKSAMQTDINLASMATAATRWDMNLDSGVDAWYQTGANTVDPNRWAAAISACQRYYNRSIYMVEGFNEPDYLVNNEGSPQNLNSILGNLQSSNNFAGTLMAGGSTLNDDVAISWFNAVAPHAAIGTTHCLAGSAANYVNFLQTVTASNAIPFNPEMHNVCEAMMGAQYGMQGGIWWGTAERARGDFVKACQGKQLGYGDDWGKWTAAAVYRAPGGSVQAFVGEAERQSLPTTYRFFSKDRDVFYDGDGPRRDFTVTTTGDSSYQSVAHRNAERVVNITWGLDVQPVINGRYVIVNRSSHLVLDVPAGNTGNIQLDQASYTGALYQQWDVNPLPNTIGGDYSYYSMKAAHSGVTADVLGGAYYNGAPIQQYNGGTNVYEQWNLQYANNGYFKIRTKFCNKVMGLSGNLIVQTDDTGTLDQQWRLIPVGANPTDFTAPAPPAGVTAVANARSVQLNWNTNSEADLAGYNVLRSTNAGGPYEIVARGLTNNAFTDKFANQTRTYYYVVRAVDQSLNSSGSSALVNATPFGGPALIASYAFEGNLNDSSVNANQPIVTNGSPAYVGSQYGSALNLNGSSQYVMLPANLLAGVTNFTIATWVYWGGGGAWQRIWDFGNDVNQYLFLTPSSGGGKLRFAITTNSYPAEQAMETSALPSNQWVHVAVTCDGTTARLYTNGVLANFAAVTLSPAVFNPALNYVGKSQFDGDPLFNGRLDDMFIYNYALSGAEVLALANAPTYPPTKIAGTVIGSPGSWNGQGNTITNAFDNNLGTFYDAANASGDWAGLDLGTAQVIKQIKYCPRSTFASRMVGGMFQGANVADFSSGVVTLFTVTATPPEGVLTSQVITDPGSYRYVRYLGPASGYCDVAELEFDRAGTPAVPPAPASLAATAGDAQVGLSWPAVTAATSYNVKRSITNGGPYAIIATNVTATSYNNSGLVNGTRYYYVVSTSDIGGESTNSLQVAARPVSTTPVNIALSNSPGSFVLSWPADHTGWRLLMSTNLAGNHWLDVSSNVVMDTNAMALPMNATNRSVFYRLVYP